MDSNKAYKKRKAKGLYEFHPNKVTRLQPGGNHLRGEDCPKPRSGHRIIVKGGNVYAFGGYTPMTSDTEVAHILFKELWKYNCASKTWQLLETTGKMPEQLASHCAVLVDNKMIVFGGTGIPFGETRSNSTYSCNLDTLEWEEIKTTGDPPTQQYGQGMLLDGKKMYVVGGTNGFSYTMQVHCLDLTTKVWTHLDTEMKKFDWTPDPRYRHEIALHNNKIFVFGGGTAHVSFDMVEIPVFCLESKTWTKITTTSTDPQNFPEPRRCHALVQIGSDAYLCGGFDGLRTFNCIWKFNLETHQWNCLDAKLPNPLYFHSAAVSEEGQMFVFGGVKSFLYNTRTNDLYSMWLKIPPLQDLCWQAALKYMPHISHMQSEKLYEAGVPFHLIKEVDFQSNATEDSITQQCCNRLEK
ncbi:hypothetical protein JTE90_018356 [Oedothorax gibbosus]|uniref:Kelch domain-containing protein 10 n=1 Tax=Oedothorax gibbosus TaxID=931172 RepID=A0AAV6U0M1_9ARAC|nr:hypothetical protein JTE90_018356 [Oedothorax gibbosus]